MAETWTTIPLNDVSTSELVTAAQLNALGNNHRFLARLGYVQFTSPVSITATSEGTAISVVSLGAITYEAVPHMIEFYSPSVNGTASNTLRISLQDGTSVIDGRFGSMFGATPYPMYCAKEFTPTAAAHTYNIKSWCGTSGGTVQAGSGGADGYGPGWIRISRVPT